MKPPIFDYYRASSVEEAVEMLTSLGEDAKLLAGGQSLVPLMAFRLARPTALVDINPIKELSYIRREDETLVIGALTRHRQIERCTDRAALEGFELLPRTATWIGHDPIRTRGTFGGSLAHADPSAEWCMLALLFDAEVVAQGVSRTRVIPAAEFFQGFFTTALMPDEVLVEVRLHRPVQHASVQELARRRGDFAIVAASVALESEDGVCRSGRVALCGVGPTPLRAVEAEAALKGATLNEDTFERVGRLAAGSVDPPSDVHASAEYRREMAALMVQRALRDAVGVGA